MDKIPGDLRDLIAETYPLGWKNNVLRINKPNGEFFHAITLETSEISYLIKVPVKVDSKADLEKEEEKTFVDQSDDTDDKMEDVPDEQVESDAD